MQAKDFRQSRTQPDVWSDGCRAGFPRLERGALARRAIDPTLAAPNDPESIREAKVCLAARVAASRPSEPARDQPELAEATDLKSARRAPSFHELWRDVCDLLPEPSQCLSRLPQHSSYRPRA